MTTAGPSLNRLQATVATLATDAYTGRRVGTVGGHAAGAWLASQLLALGADVQVEGFAVRGIRELYRVEARMIGLLIPRGTDGEGWMPKMIIGPAPGPLPVVAIRQQVHAAMVASAVDGMASATASVPLRSVQVTGHNIYAELTRPERDSLSVLLTAHYDGVGDDPEQRFPAAADNASGVAVVLEAARLLRSASPPGWGLPSLCSTARKLAPAAQNTTPQHSNAAPWWSTSTGRPARPSGGGGGRRASARSARRARLGWP